MEKLILVRYYITGPCRKSVDYISSSVIIPSG